MIRGDLDSSWLELLEEPHSTGCKKVICLLIHDPLLGLRWLFSDHKHGNEINMEFSPFIFHSPSMNLLQHISKLKTTDKRKKQKSLTTNYKKRA